MQKHATAHVFMSSKAQQMLARDIYQRQHIEACGLLLGHIDDLGNWYLQQAQPLHNICDSPVYFEFAPEDLLAAELDYPDQIVGVYHSHPTGFASASSTDRENMQRVNIEQQIPWVWLIVRGPFNGTLSSPLSIVAYHHYEQIGLQQVAIQFEEVPETTPLLHNNTE